VSTEFQQYSPENQLGLICEGAAADIKEISQDYSHHGRSRLNIAGRKGLKRLMAEGEDSEEKRKHLAPSSGRPLRSH
jgi:hypothetical protein